MAKLSENELRQLGFDMLFAPPGLQDAAEELDPNFKGGFSWDGMLVHKVNDPKFNSVDDFEYIPSADDNEQDYIPPSKEKILQKWQELFVEYCNKTYQIQRKISYDTLTVEEQLGLLWHDINSGFFGETAKQSQFYTEILQIKNNWPKG